jgi:hypothetical protein
MKFLTPVILIVIAVGVFFTFTSKQYDKVKTLLNVNSDYNSAIENSRELLKVRDTLLSKYNAFEPEEIERLEKLVPDNIDNVRLIIDINGITSKYGVALKNVGISTGAEKDSKTPTVSVGTQGKGYSAVLLKFSVTTTYENFLKILRDLESSLRIVDVVSVNLDSSGDPDIYKYDVLLKTYWLK